jgi:hypothetical protein
VKSPRIKIDKEKVKKFFYKKNFTPRNVRLTQYASWMVVREL